jgi:hypothetical protein
MPDLDALITRASTQADAAALNELADLYAADTTTAEERQAIRAAVNPVVRQVYEDMYFEGVGMDEPETFVRRTLAALYLTEGYGNPATASQVMRELRTFAAHHGVDLAAQVAHIRSLPGSRPTNPKRLRFGVGNIVLFATLVLGTLAVQAAPEPLRLILQIVVLLAVAAAQMALLYWYFGNSR